jgi:hypothetical protein
MNRKFHKFLFLSYLMIAVSSVAGFGYEMDKKMDEELDELCLLEESAHLG